MLVFGTAGVGKDVLVSECLRDASFKQRFAYSISVYGRTESDLLIQLVRFFQTQLKDVLKGCDGREEKLASIREWFKQNPTKWNIVVVPFACCALV